MKRNFIKWIASVAILMPMLFSCSGGAGSSSTLLFGSLPDVYGKFQAEKDKISEEAKNIKSEAEKAKLIEKSEKMQEEWSQKIEDSAKALDGKPIEFAESDIKVTEPLSLEFDGFFSKSSMNPKFKINGSAEVANEITTDNDYVLPSEKVCIVGYNTEGQQVYKISVGSVPVENVDGKVVIKAGTPVKLDSFSYAPSEAEEYKAAKSLKLEVVR